MLEPLVFVTAMGILGLLIGSFLNVVIHRLPKMMEREWRSECHALFSSEDAHIEEPVFNLARPRSRCPGCAAPISAFDNIPIFSYLLLRGRCRHCAKSISVRYPLVEAFSGCTTAFAAWHFGFGQGVVPSLALVQAFAAAIFVWYLICLALIDFDTQYLPDSLTQPLLWFGIICSFFGLFAPDLNSAVTGAILGYLALWSIYWLFKLVTGKEGMGYGDFKLLAAMAAWLGWQTLPALILLSSVLGAVIGITLMLSGQVRRSQPIPFGPYLALAGIVMLFWGDEIAGLLGGPVVL